MKLRHLFLTTMTAALLGACAGVPDKLDTPTLRDHAPLAGVPTDASAGWPDAKWWTHYGDPQLDTLVRMATRNSPSLAEAQRRVESAEQSVRLSAAQAGLRIDGSAKFARQRLSEHGLIPAEFLGFTWYNQADIGAQLSYDFDWWGKKRSAVEAAIGQAHAARAQSAAATLGLQTAVANTYFGWLADQRRLQLAKRQEAVLTRIGHITGLRADAGLEPSDGVHQAQAQLAAVRQQEAALAGSAAARRAALAALLGIAPDELPALMPHPLPAANTRLPEDVGLDLIARRPDVAASRWRVEAALKKTDVARAQFLPDISLSAMAGLSSIDMDKLFDPSSRVFAITPALHLPIFEGGLLQANYGLSKAQLDAAVAAYNATVVSAARDVATRSVDVQRLQAQTTQQAAQVDALDALRGTTRARQRQGLTDARPVLRAQSDWLRQRDAGIALKAQTLSADVALIEALGGGYRSHAPGVADATPSSSNVRTQMP